MSCNETKKVLRVEIPWLRGKGYNEAYKYFRSILGPADEVDQDKNETYYFYYEPNSHYYVPVKEYSERNTNNYRWGIDIILYEKNDYGEVIGKKDYSPQEIQISAAEMAEKFGVSPCDCKIYEYSWYNATDEPIIFD